MKKESEFQKYWSRVSYGNTPLRDSFEIQRLCENAYKAGQRAERRKIIGSKIYYTTSKAERVMRGLK